MTAKNCTTSNMFNQAGIKAGDVFPTYRSGDVIVVRYINNKNVVVRFDDKYRHELKTTLINIMAGSIKNPYAPVVCGVGFFGVGKHRARIGKKDTVEYQTWRHMISRCYGKSVSPKDLSYRDCDVHPDWHNFQNFAEWYTNHEFYGLGYHIDKDILFEGNKLYSEHTCELVPAEINLLFGGSGTADGTLPIGVCYNKSNKKYAAYLGINGVRKHLGYFDSSEEASCAYRTSKSSYIKEKAFKWKDGIHTSVFESLMDAAEKLVQI